MNRLDKHDNQQEIRYTDLGTSGFLLGFLVAVCTICLIAKALPDLLTKEVWQAEATIQNIDYYAPSQGETFATYIVEYEGTTYTLPSVVVSNTSQFDAGDSVPVKCTLYTNDYLDLELVITP